MKNVDHIHHLLTAHPTELAKIVENKLQETLHGSDTGISKLFIKSVNRLPNGNLILQTTSDELTDRLRTYDEWVIALAPGATILKRTYAIVAHNVPTSIWDGETNVRTAIERIENENDKDIGSALGIANICWLDSDANRRGKGSGPLMISFQNKDTANLALDYNLAINGVSCNTSLYVP
ncbi:hypothetical protein AcV5_001651 [Taiwanofungus camphoratus]|nr:hypothetical protein AcV5_001651 [Antrodia cinnamomea]